MKNRVKLILVICLAVMFALSVTASFAQEQEAAKGKAAAGKAAEGKAKGKAAGAAKQQEPRIASPIVNPDRTVTFQLRAPDAQKVAVQVQVPGQRVDMDLVKDAQGIWKASTPNPIAPGLYFYHFLLDGVIIRDPSAGLYNGDALQWGCVLIVKGEKPADYEIRDNVPRGALTHDWLMSKVFNQQRGIVVYTPPSYKDTTKKYPVLYLLHGAGGNEQTWTRKGFIDRLLDNWIADGKIDELVVVMTSNQSSMSRGEAAPQKGAEQKSGVQKGAEQKGAAQKGVEQKSAEQRGNPLVDYFEKEVKPYAEKCYRIETERTKTAVAGFSMGGSQTLSLAFTKPEWFGAVACLSGAIRGNIIEQYAFLKDPAKVHENYPIFYVVAGDNDPLLTAAKAFHDELDKAGIKHTYLTAPGGHEMKSDWTMIEKYLHDFTKGK